MFKKVLFVIINIILALLPFSTALSNFSPYWTTNSFATFLIACTIFVAISVALVWIVSRSNKASITACGLFVLGILVGPPLQLGPPALSAQLLQLTTEEHFRYGLLMLATFVFALSIFVFLKQHWQNIGIANKLIIAPLSISFCILAWDNYDSYTLSNKLQSWIQAGNTPDDFFSKYNFHETWRFIGRAFAYIVVAWFAWILHRQLLVKKWQTIVLLIFCLIGLCFCIAYQVAGSAYYFPFMVPAIMLAPAYWLGIALLNKKTIS